MQGAKEAYKEQFKLDAAYLNEIIWEKLSKAADMGKEEFIAFTEDLKAKAKEVRLGYHESEHTDHLHWSSDHEFWLDEIELWKKDHQHAWERLQAIEAAIRKHTDKLEEHAQVIRAHEARDKEHEEVLSANELDPTSHFLEEKDDEFVSIHEQERQEHGKHAELHDHLKKDRRKMMAAINNLYMQVDI